MFEKPLARSQLAGGDRATIGDIACFYIALAVDGKNRAGCLSGM